MTPWPHTNLVHPRPQGCRSCLPAYRSLGFILNYIARQPEAETRAHAQLAFQLYPSPMQLDDFFDEGQTQAKARSFPLGNHAKIICEYRIPVFRRNAGAAVDNRDAHHTVPLQRLDPDFGAGRGIFGGVIHQIVDGDPEHGLVGVDIRQFIGNAQLERIIDVAIAAIVDYAIEPSSKRDNDGSDSLRLPPHAVALQPFLEQYTETAGGS